MTLLAKCQNLEQGLATLTIRRRVTCGIGTSRASYGPLPNHTRLNGRRITNDAELELLRTAIDQAIVILGQGLFSVAPLAEDDGSHSLRFSLGIEVKID